MVIRLVALGLNFGCSGLNSISHSRDCGGYSIGDCLKLSAESSPIRATRWVAAQNTEEAALHRPVGQLV